MASFSKLTPEQVWRGTEQPNWLSVNGGTVRGNVTVNGSVTATSATLSALTVNGTATATILSSPSASLGSLTVSGNANLTTATTGAINQGVVGYPSMIFGATYSGNTLSPLAPSQISKARVGMQCTDVSYTTVGFVTFVVNNTWPFYIGQSVSVSGTTNWNGTFVVTSYALGAITCATTSTFASEPTVSAFVVPLYSAGLYKVSAIVKITQNSSPTPGSVTEGISVGLGLDLTAPTNYTTSPVQATTNPPYTITGQYGQATFTMGGLIRVSDPLSSLWVVASTGAQTGSYNLICNQLSVVPIGLLRP